MSILQVLMKSPGGTQRQSPVDETTTLVGNVLSMSSSALYRYVHYTLHIKACPHLFPKQDNLYPETETLYPETGYFVAVSGDFNKKIPCFGIQSFRFRIQSFCFGIQSFCFRIQIILFSGTNLLFLTLKSPETATKYPVSGYKVSVSGYKLSCFRNKCGQAIAHYTKNVVLAVAKKVDRTAKLSKTKVAFNH